MFAKVVGNDKDLLNRLAVDGKTVQTAGELLGFVVQASRYMLLWRKVGRTLASAPAFDYVGSKSKLEHLYTTRMPHELDRRFVEFVEQSQTTAKTLGDVIKAKQPFPQEAFARLKEAFPCIIAGIREFAEYVPLQQEIFEVVVIDEASQVSVAQAFPALLRGVEPQEDAALARPDVLLHLLQQALGGQVRVAAFVVVRPFPVQEVRKLS